MIFCVVATALSGPAGGCAVHSAVVQSYENTCQDKAPNLLRIPTTPRPLCSQHGTAATACHQRPCRGHSLDMNLADSPSVRHLRADHGHSLSRCVRYAVVTHASPWGGRRASAAEPAQHRGRLSRSAADVVQRVARHPLCGPPPTRSTNAATFRVARAPLSESPIRRDPHRAAAPTRVAAGRGRSRPASGHGLGRGPGHRHRVRRSARQEWKGTAAAGGEVTADPTRRKDSPHPNVGPAPAAAAEAAAHAHVNNMNSDAIGLRRRRCIELGVEASRPRAAGPAARAAQQVCSGHRSAAPAATPQFLHARKGSRPALDLRKCAGTGPRTPPTRLRRGHRKSATHKRQLSDPSKGGGA